VASSVWAHAVTRHAHTPGHAPSQTVTHGRAEPAVYRGSPTVPWLTFFRSTASSVWARARDRPSRLQTALWTLAAYLLHSGRLARQCDRVAVFTQYTERQCKQDVKRGGMDTRPLNLYLGRGELRMGPRTRPAATERRSHRARPEPRPAVLPSLLAALSHLHTTGNKLLLPNRTLLLAGWRSGCYGDGHRDLQPGLGHPSLTPDHPSSPQFTPSPASSRGLPACSLHTAPNLVSSARAGVVR
jgi:hypothetical protein